jgi:hypothetical protein
MKKYTLKFTLMLVYKIISIRKRHFTKMSWYHVYNANNETYGIVKQVDTENWWWSRLVRLENYIWRLRDRIDPSLPPF